MNNCDRQEQADISTSFRVFADVANDKSLFDNEVKNDLTAEQYASFGSFAPPEDVFPG